MQGQVIANRYVLVRVLGEGATGTVWLARDRAGLPVALKLASKTVAEHAASRARFLREAALAERVAGPHVARVLDHGSTPEGAPFVVSEYLEGRDLGAELAARRRLSLTETAQVVGGVCAGLANVHAAGVVHRDVKPRNVFLARADGDPSIGAVRILDFGSAKSVDWLADPTIDPTRTGEMVGTPCYMSPEQAKGLTDVDARADVWAVGVVAFECITGVRAFQAATLGTLVAKILVGPLPVPSLAAPEAEIPQAIDAWMAQVLARDPAQRSRSIVDVGDAFATAAAQAGESLSGADEEVDPAPAARSRDDSRIRAPWEAGDMATAVTVVIEELGPEILAFLGHRLHDEALADDAFSAFCERAWRGLPRFEWRCSVRTWAYRIARAAAADAQRATHREGRREEPLTESRVAAMAAHVRSATWALLRTTRRSALLELREALSESDKLLLVLRLDRGMPWQEIARVFVDREPADDVEVQRVSARLRKRFQLLREQLRDLARAKGLAGEGFDGG
jgi:RNA polymerase sigma factor (sigma-70 family)